MTIDSVEFRRTLGHFATGITVITAMTADGPVGAVANSFTSVSLEPPLIAYCAANASSTWPRIVNESNFCVNILSADQEHVSRTFATPDIDRFAHIGFRGSSVTGSPILTDVLAHIDCETEQRIPAGDHTLVIARVVDLAVHREGAPLLYFRGGYASLSV